MLLVTTQNPIIARNYRLHPVANRSNIPGCISAKFARKFLFRSMVASFLASGGGLGVTK
eukprot:UN22974